MKNSCYGCGGILFEKFMKVSKTYFNHTTVFVWYDTLAYTADLIRTKIMIPISRLRCKPDQHYRICSTQFCIIRIHNRINVICTVLVPNEGKPIFEQGHGTLAKSKNYARIVRIFCAPTSSPSDRPVRGWIDWSWLREIVYSCRVFRRNIAQRV